MFSFLNERYGRSLLIISSWIASIAIQTVAMDLTKATVVHPAPLTVPEQKAVLMLLDEVEKRAHIRWSASSNWPSDGSSVIALGQLTAWGEFAGPWKASPPSGMNDLSSEGFHLSGRSRDGAQAVLLTGKTPRAVLFAVGHLLRQLQMERGKVALANDYQVTTSPKYPLRGHQLGYRPKTHSYDAWDIHIWEQYYRDLIVFGANAIELIPPRSDDAADSPHFPRPPLEMMTAMSKLADDYALDVWIWYPALDSDYSKPEQIESALKEWRAVFEKVPRIDAILVPGGDPGHTPPRPLMTLLERQTESLRRIHPRAQMWISPQGFGADWMEEFLGILKKQSPDWLTGLVFGPQVRMPLAELRAALPTRYSIRHYPDITHTRQCQYPVPDWDAAFAITEGRECINPRPVDEAAIFRLLQPHTIGFLTYSEGCNDDVNKAVWSGLGWNPDQPVLEILREYSRYYIGEKFAEGFAQGLLSLERNWRGPIVANAGIETTLAQFQQMEREATPAQLQNWRFQQGLFRAYYDAYTRSRYLYEATLESQALEQLRGAAHLGSMLVMNRAAAILDSALSDRVTPGRRARIFELAEALFQSIRMQLSVPRYQAIGVDRGASLDTIDYPLNNRRWLQEQFARIRTLNEETNRLAQINAILNWTNPGPGGFYDDLGNSAAQPHLVRGLPFAADPGSLASSKTGFEEGDVVEEGDLKPEGALRTSWIDHAETLYDQPLVLRYTDLDPRAKYRVRIVYGGDNPQRRIRFVVKETIEIHPFQRTEFPYRPQEYDIPLAAYKDGELKMSWTREPGKGGNGRGCQVAEIWLMRLP